MIIPDFIAKKGLRILQFNQEVGVGSHLQAGARAERIASPITRALGTKRGLMMARVAKILFRGNIEALLNYAAIRPYALMEAVRIVLGDNPEHKTIVDPAAGYSPDFYWLAQEYPDTSFVEFDIHEVIEFKRAAFYPHGIPSNLRLRPIDLSRQELHQVQTERVDAMVILGAYVSHKDFQDALTYLDYMIQDKGYLIIPFPYKPGIDNFTDNSFIFTKLVSTPAGALNKASDLEKIFEGTNFSLQQTIKLSDFAEREGRATPADIELIAIVQHHE